MNNVSNIICVAIILFIAIILLQWQCVDAKIISCFEMTTILDLHKYQNGNARLSVLVLQKDVKWWQVQMWLLMMQQYSGEYSEILAWPMWCQYLLLQYSGQWQCAASIWSIANCKILEPLVLNTSKAQNTKSWAALVEEVAEAIASYQNHQYYIPANIVQNLASILQYCWDFFFHIAAVKYCIFHLSWSLATSLLSYYFCVFWQMQLLRFSYFSKFKYYIDVLKYS